MPELPSFIGVVATGMVVSIVIRLVFWYWDWKEAKEEALEEKESHGSPDV